MSNFPIGYIVTRTEVNDLLMSLEADCPQERFLLKVFASNPHVEALKIPQTLQASQVNVSIYTVDGRQKSLLVRDQTTAIV